MGGHNYLPHYFFSLQCIIIIIIFTKNALTSALTLILLFALIWQVRKSTTIKSLQGISLSQPKLRGLLIVNANKSSCYYSAFKI